MGMGTRFTETALTIFVGVVLVFLLLPIVVVIPSAFSDDVALAFPPKGFSLRWFGAVFGRPEFVHAFGISALVAVIATSISLVAGCMAAYALVRFRFPGRATLEMLFLTPLIFPTIVLAIALTTVLGSVGLLRTFSGLVLAHVIITLPYTVRTLAATLRQIDPSIEEVALTLGANPLAMFRWVVFPMIRPGLLAAAVFALIISFDEFTVSLFLVGPGLYTLPIAIFNYTEFNIDPAIAVVSTILIALSCIAVIIIEKMTGLARLLS